MPATLGLLICGSHAHWLPQLLARVVRPARLPACLHPFFCLCFNERREFSSCLAAPAAPQPLHPNFSSALHSTHHFPLPLPAPPPPAASPALHLSASACSVSCGCAPSFWIAVRGIVAAGCAPSAKVLLHLLFKVIGCHRPQQAQSMSHQLYSYAI